MSKLNLTPNHKAIKQYYEMQHEKKQMGFQVKGKTDKTSSFYLLPPLPFT